MMLGLYVDFRGARVGFLDIALGHGRGLGGVCSVLFRFLAFLLHSGRACVSLSTIEAAVTTRIDHMSLY